MLNSRAIVVLCLVLAVAAGTSGASAQNPVPTFTKTFTPDTIGPGSISTLRFDVTSSGSVGARDLAFSDTLPSGVTVASPGQILSTCGGSVTAVSGTGTIGFSGGSVRSLSTCSISVDVTASTPGTSTNVSGDLTSDAGNSGSATADLTVATNRPGFTKSFSPGTVSLGGRSTLTFTIDNTANASQVFNLSFTDSLPSGMVVASPANASTDCPSSTFTATVGSGTVSLTPSFPVTTFLAAGATCTATVDVLGNATGALGNTTSELTFQSTAGFLSAGKAGAALNVTADRIALEKSFTDDPVPPGGIVTLRFTIRNLDRAATATNISFTDDLGATLSGLASTSGTVSACGGSMTGTSTLSLTGGTLSPEETCTFSVSLQVPSTAPTGTYGNTTSAISADLDGQPMIGAAASDVLVVQATPLLTKSFVDDPTGAGGTVTLEFSITNTSSDFAATDITFEDIFDVVLPTASSVPANGFCGAGSTATFFPLTNPTGLDATPARLVVSGASLAASATCTFSIVLDVAVSAAGGIYPNTTSTLTGTVNGEAVTGDPATDDLVLVAAPALIKEFTDDPVSPGDPVTLEFTLTQDELAAGDATGITFTDDLDAALSGLASTSGTLTDVCGTGSQITGTSTLTFSGGTLAPGESCTFSVTLSTPSTAPAGPHANTTSTVMATVVGAQALSNAASDDLDIAGLVLTKKFLDDPVLPGGTVTLRFTVRNDSPVSSATSIVFSDNLSSALSGLAATGLPLADPCGAGSTLIGLSANRTLVLTDGSLAPGASCTFDVTLQVPAGAVSDDYSNVTSGFSADIDGTTVFFDNAADVLSVNDSLLTLSKEFTDDPVRPGDTVTLLFELESASGTGTFQNLEFTDDLDAVLPGLVSLSGTLTDVCGSGSQIAGTDFLTFTGGSLAAGESCSFSVTLEVPEESALGLTLTNTTSEVTGTLGGLSVRGDPASDVLSIDALTFTKSFSGPVFPGDTVTVLFQIQSTSGTPVFEDLGFFDDLDAVLPGLEAVGLPLTDVCGAGSVLDGTSLLTLQDATVLPGGSCSIPVTLAVPVDAETGSFLNVTSALLQDGLPVAQPATATLTVLGQAAACPDPETIDYQGFTAANCASSNNAVTVRSQQELDAYLVDFGFNGTKVKNVRVKFNPSGQVEIVSPCEIIWSGDSGVHVQADNVCLYGRKGIAVGGTGGDQSIEAGTITLVSEEGDAGFTENLTLLADALTVTALREAKIGLSCDVSVSGPLSLLSVGDLTGSNAIVRQNSNVTADTLLVQASRDARIGIGTSIAANTIDLHSTGTASESEARIRQSAEVTAGTFSQTSGNKIRVGIGTDITVIGNYHLNAAGSCSIASSATIVAGSTSGNCFNPPAGLVTGPIGLRPRRLGGR